MKQGASVAIIFVILLLLLSYFATAGIIWLMCWAFSWTWWSWKACFGIWLLMFLLSSTFKSVTHSKK